MYSIVQTSGKQFLFQPQQWYDLDFIKDVNLGDFIALKKILLFKKVDKIQLGRPFLEKSQIIAKVIQQVKGTKITVLKTRPKKNYTRTKGNRQTFTRVSLETFSNF
jgi:large subunit ribosomal protein L21